MADSENRIYRIGVISDTHGRLSASVFERLEGVDRLYHCGDFGSLDVVLELQAIAPLSGVAGNCDPWPVAGQFTEELVEQTPLGTVALLHGDRYGHDPRAIVAGMQRDFAEAAPRLCCFGHTHRRHLESRNGCHFLNPGSARLPKDGGAPSLAIVEGRPGSGDLFIRHVDI